MQPLPASHTHTQSQAITPQHSTSTQRQAGKRKEDGQLRRLTITSTLQPVVLPSMSEDLPVQKYFTTLVFPTPPSPTTRMRTEGSMWTGRAGGEEGGHGVGRRRTH